MGVKGTENGGTELPSFSAKSFIFNGANGQIRTDDLVITNHLLYP